MKNYKEILPLKNDIKRLKSNGKSIGFVPTMGNLHEGHLSLIRRSTEENDITVLSIYVNPTQFGPAEDLDKYPRTLENDLKSAEKTGCDIVFMPDDKIMYGDGFSTYVNEGHLSKSMCGERRPGHFKGVTTVVTKLFNIVEPTIAYFGQKDAQQALVIKRMVRDLNFDLEIRVLPIVREKNGLAMSSRNNYLKDSERDRAGIIFKSLLAAEKAFYEGERDPKNIFQIVRSVLREEPELAIDYIELRSCNGLKESKRVEEETLLAIGTSFKGIHLIDNIVLKP